MADSANAFRNGLHIKFRFVAAPDRQSQTIHLIRPLSQIRMSAIKKIDTRFNLRGKDGETITVTVNGNSSVPGVM